MSDGKQQLQTAINQESLMINVAEDIANACKKAEIHPDLVRVLIRMHSTQHDLDKELKAQRKANLEMANVIDMIANSAVASKIIHEALADKTGLDIGSLFQPEENKE